MTYELAFDLIPDTVDGDVSARSSTFPRRQRMSPPRSVCMERQESQPVLTHLEYSGWVERRAASLSAATGARVAAALVPGGGAAAAAGRSLSRRGAGGRARATVMGLFPSPVPEMTEEMSYPQPAACEMPMSPMQDIQTQPQPHIEAAFIQPVHYEQFQQQPPTPPLAHVYSPPAPPQRPVISRGSTATSTSFYNHDDYNYELPDSLFEPKPADVPTSPKANLWPPARSPVPMQDLPHTPSPVQMQSPAFAYPTPVSSPPYVQYHQQHPQPPQQMQPETLSTSSPVFMNPRQQQFPPHPAQIQQHPFHHHHAGTPWAQVAVQQQPQHAHVYTGQQFQ